MEYADIVTRVQASLQRGVETVERSRVDREGETRVFLTVESIDVEIPIQPDGSGSETDGSGSETDGSGSETDDTDGDAGDRTDDALSVTPGSGDGRLRFSFVPSKIGRLDPGPAFPLTYLQGVGDATARRLRDAGIEDVRALASSDPRAVAVDTGLSADRARRFVEMARHVKLGADNQLAEALVSLDFDRRTLAETSREQIRETVLTAASQGRLPLPRDYEVDATALDSLSARATRTGALSGDVSLRTLDDHTLDDHTLDDRIRRHDE